jgi:uncharacterized membrane protein
MEKINHELKKQFNEYAKLRARVKKHGDPNKVNKRIPEKTEEEKKEWRRNYYQNVLKPKRDAEKALKPHKVVKTSEDKKQANRRYYLEVVKPKIEARKEKQKKEKELKQKLQELEKKLEEEKQKELSETN